MPITKFLWNEWDDNLFQETDENNVVTSYVHLPGKFGEILFDKQGNRFSFYHFDGNGSTRKLTNINQETIKTYIFSGFGELIASPGLGSTSFAYKGAAGYYTNPVTNDIYVRARTYEPTTGRWLSKDPLGFVDGPNLFGAYFVPGRLDPSGKLTSRPIKGTAFCHGCGQAGLQWKVSTDEGSEEHIVIQKICVFLTAWVCREQEACCVPDHEESCSICWYELLMESPGFALDDWQPPYFIHDQKCGSIGAASEWANIYAFPKSLAEELVKKPPWIKGGGTLNCGEFSIKVSTYLPVWPEFEANLYFPWIVVGHVHTDFSLHWNCCGPEDGTGGGSVSSSNPKFEATFKCNRKS